MRPGPEQPSRGASFYDDAQAFDRYLRHRHAGAASPNVVMEEPAFLEIMGDVSGQRVLDLGCGDGSFGRAILQQGAAMYVGVDASTRMVAAAEAALRGTEGRVVCARIESFAPPVAGFDLVVSRLAFHYIADLGSVFATCRRGLVPGGRLVVTVVHPVLTAPKDPVEPGRRTSWVVDDYFQPGPRTRSWLGGTVVWHHRTVEQYVAALSDAGFTLTALGECPPRRDLFAGDDAEFARRCRVPLFLVLGAMTPSEDPLMRPAVAVREP